MEKRVQLTGRKILFAFGVLLISALFITSIQLIGAGFQHLGSNLADSIFSATSNPFIGLFIGLLVTAILQSSSTTTTMTVALVASESLPLEHAVPIVIGANIGTTLTSTLVSLSYITRKNEFVRAFSAGIVHDLFNISVALLIFPLELRYQFLSKTSHYLAQLFPVSEGSFFIRGIDRLFQPIAISTVNSLGALFTILLGLVLLFTSVKVVSQLLYKQWVNRSANLDGAFRNRFRVFGFGLLTTSVIQSSSLMTSLMVPLVATGKISLKRAFAFIIGTNLGTTVTAILAAIFKSEVALSLAFAHFIFNLIGCILFLSIPYLFNGITKLATQLGVITLRYRTLGIAYVMFTFFIFPFTLIYLSQFPDSRLVKKDRIETTAQKAH